MALVLRKSNAYSKIDKEEPEERNRRRAQFLIYKVMEQADLMSRRRPSYLRIRIRKLKVKIGKRLIKLRKSMLLSISAAKVSVCKQVCSQFKTCRRLFGGGDNHTSTNLVNTLPSPLFV